jgi:phosphatidate cytidylyltransferase
MSLILIAGGADTFAMFIGKAFGRRKFFSRISPNKTVEGFLGGTISGIGVGILCWSLFPLKVCFLRGLILACALSLISHLGDLAESILKRDAGVKDSGRLPGVGGVLDLMDSGLFAAPVTYFLMKLWFRA